MCLQEITRHMTPIIQSNLAELSKRLGDYARLRKMTAVDAVKKQSREFSFFLADELKKQAPAKGEIRSAALGWLKGRSKGVFVRESIKLAVAKKYNAITIAGIGRKKKDGTRYGRSWVRTKKTKFGQEFFGEKKGTQGKKKLNLQALTVRRELNMRESGNSFMAFAARLRGIDDVAPGSAKFWLGRMGQKTADSKLQLSGDGDEATMRIVLGGSKSNFGDALQKPAGQEAINRALRETITNMELYIARKEKQAASVV